MNFIHTYDELLNHVSTANELAKERFGREFTGTMDSVEGLNGQKEKSITENGDAFTVAFLDRMPLVGNINKETGAVNMQVVVMTFDSKTNERITDGDPRPE